MFEIFESFGNLCYLNPIVKQCDRITIPSACKTVCGSRRQVNTEFISVLIRIKQFKRFYVFPYQVFERILGLHKHGCLMERLELLELDNRHLYPQRYPIFFYSNSWSHHRVDTFLLFHINTNIVFSLPPMLLNESIMSVFFWKVNSDNFEKYSRLNWILRSEIWACFWLLK